MAEKNKDGTKLLGKGMAKQAADSIKEERKKKQSRLSIITGEIRKARGGK